MNTFAILKRAAAGVAFSALILQAQIPVAASAQDMGYYRSHNGFTRRPGHIVSVNGSSFTLGDGTTIFEHQGTVILPTGIILHRGMNVYIDGFRDGRGRINADRIVVRRR
jgi:hypothetical protein